MRVLYQVRIVMLHPHNIAATFWQSALLMLRLPVSLFVVVVVVVVVASRLFPWDAGQLSRAWTRGRKETESPKSERRKESAAGQRRMR